MSKPSRFGSSGCSSSSSSRVIIFLRKLKLRRRRPPVAFLLLLLLLMVTPAAAAAVLGLCRPVATLLVLVRPVVKLLLPLMLLLVLVLLVVTTLWRTVRPHYYTLRQAISLPHHTLLQRVPRLTLIRQARSGVTAFPLFHRHRVRPLLFNTKLK